MDYDLSTKTERAPGWRKPNGPHGFFVRFDHWGVYFDRYSWSSSLNWWMDREAIEAYRKWLRETGEEEPA